MYEDIFSSPTSGSVIINKADASSVSAKGKVPITTSFDLGLITSGHYKMVIRTDPDGDIVATSDIVYLNPPPPITHEVDVDKSQIGANEIANFSIKETNGINGQQIFYEVQSEITSAAPIETTTTTTRIPITQQTTTQPQATPVYLVFTMQYMGVKDEAATAKGFEGRIQITSPITSPAIGDQFPNHDEFIYAWPVSDDDKLTKGVLLDGAILIHDGGSSWPDPIVSFLFNVQLFMQTYPNAKQVVFDFRAFWYNKAITTNMVKLSVAGGALISTNFEGSWTLTDATGQTTLDLAAATVDAYSPFDPVFDSDGNIIDQAYGYTPGTGFGTITYDLVNNSWVIAS